MEDRKIVAYRLKDSSNLENAREILKEYLIEHEIWAEGRDMSKEGESFALNSAFYDVFARNGLLDDWYSPVYFDELESVKTEELYALKRKAENWDKLGETISKYYCGKDGEFSEESPESEGDLCDMGYDVASAFGWM